MVQPAPNALLCTVNYHLFTPVPNSAQQLPACGGCIVQQLQYEMKKKKKKCCKNWKDDKRCKRCPEE
jgi:hypothetical protein